MMVEGGWESKVNEGHTRSCVWLRCSSPLWLLSLSRNSCHYTGTQGQCDIGVPIFHLPQVFLFINQPEWRGRIVGGLPEPIIQTWAHEYVTKQVNHYTTEVTGRW